MSKIRWTKDDDDLVMSGADFHVIAQILGRSYYAVKSREYKLRTGQIHYEKARVNGWSDAEISEVEHMVEQGVSGKEIAERTGRTLNAIYLKIGKMRKALNTDIEEKPNATSYGFDPKVGKDPDKYWQMKMRRVG